MSTGDLLTRHRAATAWDEIYYLEQELDQRSIHAWIEVVEQEDWTGDDEVFLVIGGPSVGLSTGAVAIPEGESHVFRMNVSRLMPLPDPITIDVNEFDVDSADHIGSLTWPAPYTPMSSISLEGDDAHYVATVTF